MQCGASDMLTPLEPALMPRASKKEDSNPTPLSLLLRAGRGDQDAWEEFYGLYAPLVFRYARRRGLDEHQADDLVIEVMHNLLKRMTTGFQVDHSKGRFRDYLRKVAMRTISRLRGRRARGTIDQGTIEIADHGTADEFARLERAEVLMLAMRRLRDSGDFRARDLEAFEQCALHGIAPARVARLYGLTRSQVYEIRRQVLRRLRTILVKLDLELEIEP